MKKIKLQTCMIKGFVFFIFIIIIIFFLQALRYPTPRYENLTNFHPRQKPINDASITCDIDDVVQLVLVACQGESGNTLKETLKISKWPQKATQTFTLTIHPLTYPLPPHETEEMMNWWEKCASFRLFLPEVMSEVEAILYIDIDVIFVGPVEEIWKYFYKFDPSQVSALSPRVGWEFKVPPNNPNYVKMPSGKLTQVNSGVFLMNLTRMRMPVFKTSTEISSQKQTWGRDFLLPLYRQNIKDMHGDQNLINIAFHYNPDLVYFLPCRHNYQHKFCFDNYRERFCKSAEEDGAHVIHGSANTFYNQYAPPFRIINNVMTQYNFEEDVKKFLLEPIVQQLHHLVTSDQTHCANKTELFIKTLRKSIAAF